MISPRSKRESPRGEPLAGLNWAGIYKWPGEIKDGNGQRLIVIDERADDAQRAALETIVGGSEICDGLVRT